MHAAGIPARLGKEVNEELPTVVHVASRGMAVGLPASSYDFTCRFFQKKRLNSTFPLLFLQHQLHLFKLCMVLQEGATSKYLA